MILTFTDFGVGSPYLAQMRAALLRNGLPCEVIDLVADVQPYNLVAASHLLASQTAWFPQNALFLGVVDPGVGSDRLPIVVKADGQWFVGPDNGLFDVVAARADRVEKYQIIWEPEQFSASFHGRDLFAPIAAAIANGSLRASDLTPIPYTQNPDSAADLAEVIYLDHYGNAFTGLRADGLEQCLLHINGVDLSYARTFSQQQQGEPFWYCNSVGLVEIAVTEGSAVELLGIAVGDLVELRQ